MKLKLYSIPFLILILFSCSSDDNSSSGNTSINPPSWIQGTWYLEDGSNNSGFRFTSNDFCIIALNTLSCSKQQIESALGAGTTASVEEDISNDFYSLSVSLSFVTTVSEFEKISDTKIRWVNSPTSSIYVKQ